MLNRTLSANLNGLNLGTRTLANFAGLNIFGQAALVPASHPRLRKDSMRGGDANAMREPSKPKRIRGTRSIPASPCSPFGPYRGVPTLATSPSRSGSLVVARPVASVVPSLWFGRAAQAAGALTSGDPRACGWPETTARTETTPVAIIATGG